MPRSSKDRPDVTTIPSAKVPTGPGTDEGMVYETTDDDSVADISSLEFEEEQLEIDVDALVAEIEKRTRRDKGQHLDLSALRDIPREITPDDPLAATYIEEQKTKLETMIPDLTEQLKEIDARLANIQVRLDNPSGEVSPESADSKRPKTMPLSVHDILPSDVPEIVAYAASLAKEQMRTSSSSELEKERNFLVLQREAMQAELAYMKNLLKYCELASGTLDDQKTVRELYEPDEATLTATKAKLKAGKEKATAEEKSTLEALKKAERRLESARAVLTAIGNDEGRSALAELEESLQAKRDLRTQKDSERQKAQEEALKLKAEKETKHPKTAAQRAVEDLREQRKTVQATLAELHTSIDALRNHVIGTVVRINELGKNVPHEIQTISSTNYAPAETGNELVPALQRKYTQVNEDLTKVKDELDQKKNALDNATNALNTNTDTTKTVALSRTLTTADDAYNDAKSQAGKTLDQLSKELEGILGVLNELSNMASPRFKANFPEESRIMQPKTMSTALISALEEKKIKIGMDEKVPALEQKFNEMIAEDEKRRAELDAAIKVEETKAETAKKTVDELDQAISDEDGLRSSIQIAMQQSNPREAQGRVVEEKEAGRFTAARRWEIKEEALVNIGWELSFIETALKMGTEGRRRAKDGLEGKIRESQSELAKYIADEGEESLKALRQILTEAYTAYKEAEAEMHPGLSMRAEMTDVATGVIEAVVPELNRVVNALREEHRFELKTALRDALDTALKPLEDANTKLKEALKSMREVYLPFVAVAGLAFGTLFGMVLTSSIQRSKYDDDTYEETTSDDDDSTEDATPEPTPATTPEPTPSPLAPVPTGQVPTPTPRPTPAPEVVTPAPSPTPAPRRTPQPPPRPAPTPTPTPAPSSPGIG